MAFRHDIPDDQVRVEFGRVERSLPAYALAERAQVVVMGAVSRGFSERAFAGQTAEKVVDALACDILIVKPEGFQSPISSEPAPAVPRPT